MSSLSDSIPRWHSAWSNSIVDSRWLPLVILALASVFSVQFHGFEFPYNNNVFHAPIALDVFHSVEGPHDALHQSLNNFVSGFWQVVKLFTTEDNIREVFFALHLATRFAILTLLWLIVRSVAIGARQSALAFVVALPFFVGLLGSISPLGHHELFVNYLTHSEVATVFVLLAWLLQSQRRWVWAAAALGVGFNVNAFVAVWAATVLWLAMMFAEQDSPITVRLRTTLNMMLGFSVVAAPTVIWIVRSQLTDAAAPTYDFREFLLDYFPYHTFIHVQVERVGCFAVLAGTCALLVADLRARHDAAVSRMWTGTFIGLFLVVALGMALPYLTGSRLLLNLYPLRMDAFVAFLTATLLCGQLTSRTDADPAKALLLIGLFSFANGNLWLLFVSVAAALHNRENSRLWSILCMGAIAALVLHGFDSGKAPLLREELKFGQAIAAAILAGGVAGFALRERHWSDPLLPAIVLAIATGVVDEVGALPLLGAYFVTIVTLLRSSHNLGRRELMILWLCSGTMLVVLAVVSTISANPKLDWLPIACAVGAAALGRIPNSIARIPWSRWGLAMAPALFACMVSVGVGLLVIVKGTSARTGHNEETYAFLEVTAWARQNTSPDTVFLTPDKVEGFYVYSRRPAWVEWKSGAAAMWEPSYYPEWSSRSKEVARLSNAQSWLLYAQEKHIPYVLFSLQKLSVEETTRLAFRVRNKYFGIVQVYDR